MRIIVNKPAQYLAEPVLDLGNGPSKQTEKAKSNGPSGDSFRIKKANNRFKRTSFVAYPWDAKVSGARTYRSSDAFGSIFAATVCGHRLNRCGVFYWVAYVPVMAIT
jgi:hypothetical protein